VSHYVIYVIDYKKNQMDVVDSDSRLSRIDLMMLCSELAVLNEEEYFCRHKAFWNSSVII